LDLHGYMTVPGYHGIETRSFFPSKPNTAEKSQNWTPGNPLIELAEARGIPETAPPRCLLPRFPDDPKARFMQDLDDEVGLVEDAGSFAITSPSKHKSSRWKSIADLERFWEAMEFRQECSSGRVVGFLWLVIRPPPSEIAQKPTVFDRESSPSINPNSQDSQTSTTSSLKALSSSQRSKRRKPLTGPIIPRAPRLKGSSSNISTTSNPDSSAGASRSRNGPVLSQEGYDSAMAILLNLDFSTGAAAAHSTAKWVAEVSRMAGVKAEEWALDVEGSAAVETTVGGGGAGGSGQVLNDLGGLVRRKKRKVDEGEGDGSQGGKTVEPEPAAAAAAAAPAGVNVLVGRKKAKS
jgi:regulator of Ty1 transposition protein 109